MELGERISAFSCCLLDCYLLCGGTVNGQRAGRGAPEEVRASIHQLMDRGEALAANLVAADLDATSVTKVMHWIAYQDATKLGIDAPLVPDLSAVTGELAALAMRARTLRARETATPAHDSAKAPVARRKAGDLLSEPQLRVYYALRRRLAAAGSVPSMKTLARNAKIRDASVREALARLRALGLIVWRDDGSMQVNELPGSKAEP